VFVGRDSDPFEVMTLVAGSETQLYQRVSGQTLEVDFATSTYAANVEKREVTFNDAMYIRFLLVVKTAPSDADAYVDYSVKPGSAGVAGEVVRGTPEP